MQCKSVRSASASRKSQTQTKSNLEPHTIFQLFSNCQAAQTPVPKRRVQRWRWTGYQVLEEKSSLIALHTKWINVIEEEDVASWHCRGRRFFGSQESEDESSSLRLRHTPLFRAGLLLIWITVHRFQDSGLASFSLSKGLRLHCWQLSNAAHRPKDTHRETNTEQTPAQTGDWEVKDGCLSG